MSKRVRDTYDTPESPISPLARPTKRIHAASSPVRASTSKLPVTPCSVHVLRTPFSIPSDSPTNPFGLKRSLVALDLPPETSFSKHTTLRLQLVNDAESHSLPSQRREREGVYRVVQVPTSYTFRHLHKLILFLFASDIQQYHGSKRCSLPSQTRQTLPSRVRATLSHKAAGKARDNSSQTWGGHYFEVQKKISLFPTSKKSGVIKDGKTWAKLSSVREGRLFRDLTNPHADVVTSLPSSLEDEDVDREDWHWEAEDDFTLGHVWPDCPSLDKGIIYHHTPTVRIHITSNALDVPTRRGKGNTPFIFLAQGTAGPLIKIAHTIPDINGNASYHPSNDKNEESPSLLLPVSTTFIERWNKPDAFQRFLRREADRERALRAPALREFDEDDCQSPGPLMAPSSDLMDISMLSSRDELGSDDTSIYSTLSDSILYPFALRAITPFPTNPLHRKRVERTKRRLEKLTRSGLSDMLSSDEEENAKHIEKHPEKPEQSRKAKSSSVLLKGKKVIDRMKGKPKRKAGVRDDSGLGMAIRADGWDPFGDEAELHEEI